MELKEKIQKEIKKIEESYNEAVEIFKEFKKGEMTEKELFEKVDKSYILFDEERKEIKNGIDFFEEGNKLTQKGWEFDYFIFDVTLSNAIILKSAVFKKEVPQKIKPDKVIKLGYIETLLKKMFGNYYIYLDCSVLKEFLDGKIDEESFVKIVTMQCDL